MNYKKIIPLLIAVLGFTTACQKGELMYGIPSTGFKFKGKVSNQKGNPIKNIQITVQQDSHNYIDTVYTDQDGYFEVRNSFSSESNKTNFTCKAEDIDKEENGGEFNSNTIIVSIKESEYTKANGKVNSQIDKKVNFKLEKK